MPSYPPAADWVLKKFREGQAIPAHPLALTAQRKLDERHQRALTRYYHQAGAGGIAVGVHTTQFSIREPDHGLLKPVLQLAAETVAACDAASGRQTLRIAGICGATKQAAAEVQLARELGYHAGLLSLGALQDADGDELITHCHVVAQQIPLIGFYLQSAAGGRLLGYRFWRRFVEIPNVIAIKIAPFNRYQTLDVVRAVAESGRANEISLYTGNDDHIVLDLLTEFIVPTAAGEVKLRIAGGLLSAKSFATPWPRDGEVRLRMAGGLLGHWSCWTRKAVELLEECKLWHGGKTIPARLLTLAAQITDCNAAFFDPANGFAGCIPGIHEVLRRQGLLKGTWCLDPAETLSPGQAEEINRVSRAYPDLADNEFVREHLDQWLS